MAVQASQGHVVHKMSIYYSVISNPLPKNTYIAKDVFAVLLQVYTGYIMLDWKYKFIKYRV